MAEMVAISQEAVDELLRDKDGPVGDLMREIAMQIADVARTVVRVREPGPGRYGTGRTSNAASPGYTKRNIIGVVGNAKTHNDYVFGGANAPGDPGIFLEAPAEQMYEKYPFLTTGLDSIWIG